MGDTLKKVHPGDPLRIPAVTFNTLIDVARDHQANRQNATRQPGAVLPPPGVILTIRNDSGADRNRFEVLGLDDPVFPPEDNTADFSRGPIMSAVIPYDPTHLAAFAVLLEPISDGAVGRAIVQGAAYVQVKIADADVATWADIADGQTGHLVAGTTGSAKIVWRASSGTGTVWCVCLLGASIGNQISVTADDKTIDTLRSNDTDPHKVVGDNETQITEVYDITDVGIGPIGTVTVEKVGNIVTGSQVSIAGIIGSVGDVLNGNTYYVAVAGSVLTLYTDADRTATVDTSGKEYTSDGTVTHIQDTSAGNGWIDFVVLGPGDTNQQLLAKHKHVGKTLDTSSIGSGCGVLNLRFDAGHVVAFSALNSEWVEQWFDAITGEEL